MEADGVLADRLDFGWTRRRLKHGQSSRNRLKRIPGLAAVLLTLFVAQGTGAGIAQKRETKRAPVPVFPLDFHAGTGGEVDFDGFRISDEVHTPPLLVSHAKKPGEDLADSHSTRSSSGPLASPPPLRRYY